MAIMILRPWLVLLLMLGLTACSTDSSPESGVDDSEGNSPETSAPGADTPGQAMTGRFLDSAVQGLGFRTTSGEGVTNAAGEFSYLEGESVIFFIGDVVLPAIQARPLITALDLFDTTDQFNTSVLNLNRLLQSLDTDMRPSNGITIGPAAAGSATGLSLDFGSRNFDDQAINLVANSGSGNSRLVDIPTASTHFFNTLESNNISSGCSSSHPSVGASGTFVMFDHDVAGTLTVTDDCTLEIRGFDYDGQGPDVYFFAANGSDYASTESFIIGPRLNRSLWQNDSLRLTLPEGKTLDDFNNISVWCLDFQIDFGSVSLVN